MSEGEKVWRRCSIKAAPTCWLTVCWLNVFAERERKREKLGEKGHRQPHTLNLYTPLAGNQTPRSSLSSQHTPTSFPSCPPAPPPEFSIHHALLVWDQAKPSNTKHLALIPICPVSAHSLCRRAEFSTSHSHSGRFMKISRENALSVHYRPRILTLTQLGFFSSQQDKIIQRETKKIIHFSEPEYDPSGFS